VNNKEIPAGAASDPHDPLYNEVRVLLAGQTDSSHSRAIVDICAQLGVNCSSAFDALTTLSLLKDAAAAEQPFDILMMHQNVKGLSFEQLIRVVRSNDDVARIKVVLMLTANDSSEFDMPDTGLIDMCLALPVGLSDIERMLRSLLQKTVDRVDDHSRDDAPPIVSESVVDELRNLLGDQFAGAVDVFATQTRGLVADLAAGLKDEDWALVRRSSHTLKGSAGAIGGQRLAKASEDLMRKMDAGDVDGAAQWIADVEAQTQALFRALGVE